jgi:hypothetical protein
VSATPPVSPAPAPVPPAVPAQPSAPVAPAFNPNIQAEVDNLHLSGVRLAGDNSRILVNGEVYSIGDVLTDHDLKLKVSAIAPREIIFVDDSGTQYIKRF